MGDMLKDELRPWLHVEWCVPEHTGDFAAAMEDELRVYEHPRQPRGDAAVGCRNAGNVLHHPTRSPS